MGKIVRWYNQNKRIIFVVVLIIIAVISLIQILNNYYKSNTKDEGSSTNSSATTYNTNNYSVITDKKIEESTAIESNNLIDSFFKFCNNGEIENAYNLLSTECKEELYPTIEKFTDKYYKRIFTEKRSYRSTLWISTNTKNTYRLEIMGDILAIGELEYTPIESYFTILKEDGEYKLSINSYIGKEEINCSNGYNGIDVEVISKKIYMDYEIYEIKVDNHTGKRILFNSKQKTDSMYLETQNELKYKAFLNEILIDDFIVQNGHTKTFNVKFNKEYNPNINIERIVFSDIVIENNEERLQIQVEI